MGENANLAKCDELLNRLMKRRRWTVTGLVMPSEDEVEREKAPDFERHRQAFPKPRRGHDSPGRPLLGNGRRVGPLAI